MRKYGVLVVDDSSFMRRSISRMIEQDEALFVIAIARNGKEALEKVERLRPDLVTLDIEMPEMDGLQALAKIMKDYPVPVVILSNHAEKGAQNSVRALELGALDVFLKSKLIQRDLTSEAVTDFLRRIKVIAEEARLDREGLASSAGSSAYKNAVTGSAYQDLSLVTKRIDSALEKTARPANIELLIIGSSTGGPSALQSLLPRFTEATKVPIIVLQHMPEGFTKALAQRFDSFCQRPVSEAVDGEILQEGRIYVGPAGFQTELQKTPEGSIVLQVRKEGKSNHLYKPSINVTLHSAAPLFREKLLTVILTGMGNDGMEGCKDVKHYQGTVLVEAEESCIVYGMPKAVFEAGYADKKVPLPLLYQQIMTFL
ncbi:chemotaxis-specific protein-glutamate methyltransferase CheB [Heliorestis acidaminivorans]|uniref:Protein-glutamate methylesterase/protein-glutamine glutaminase n=1 Tax=Heliorestis acidaminivorans TaxID=553427 RepID=A0A6I0F1A2_9FIRM|nr:chemotaxis-specific protein-glutamate methyltransferase CheB [Heliorestis acidaminivorans]KAB2952967.1 chemotaxis-specific protein-glutamate methyltransferase CheB [Heliorestis acidaminivorans]